MRLMTWASLACSSEQHAHTDASEISPRLELTLQFEKPEPGRVPPRATTRLRR